MIFRSPQEKRDNLKARGNTHRIANQLRRYFSPASVLPPPGSTRGATGNRNTAQTADNSPNTTPTDNVILQLIPTGTPGAGASANWRFKTQFNNPPTVTVTAISPYNLHGSTVAQELYAQGKGNAFGAIIHSTADDDNRLVFVHAVGNPS